MSAQPAAAIPGSTLRWLDELPRDRPVAMLIRHAARGHLDEGDAGYAMPLTPEGHAAAEALGRRLQGRLRVAHASPLLRTRQTAERLLAGAGAPGEPVPDTLLGDPGVFMLDGRAGPLWGELGHERMLARLMADEQPLPGCADADAAARALVHHMLAHAGPAPGVAAFSTHDSLITVTVARLLGRPLDRAEWPRYLEAAFFWMADGHVHSAYQDRSARRLAPLLDLTPRDVLSLAQRELAATVGPGCPARFFLAGGAFKTLLTGRPPRDLDLFCPSAEDRATLRRWLMARGATAEPPGRYNELLQCAGRQIELPYRTDHPTLEARLCGFDLGLSAVGVEHLPGGELRAHIHPRALESVHRREVLLLDELLNWRHALGTLERLRRYGAELGYAVPPAEEERLWAIFEAQDEEMRAGMRERLRLTSRRDQGVEEELRRRWPNEDGRAPG